MRYITAIIFVYYNVFHIYEHIAYCFFFIPRTPVKLILQIQTHVTPSVLFMDGPSKQSAPRGMWLLISIRIQ